MSGTSQMPSMMLMVMTQAYVFCDFGTIFHGDPSGLIPVCVMIVSAVIMALCGLIMKKTGWTMATAGAMVKTPAVTMVLRSFCWSMPISLLRRTARTRKKPTAAARPE